MPDIRIPGPDHPITITPANQHIVVKNGGVVIADTRNALSLKEADYPAVLYVPPQDVEMAQLTPTDHHTYCPYKGDCSYYSIAAAGERGVNAVWSYKHPYASVTEIEGHLAFYPNRVEIESTDL